MSAKEIIYFVLVFVMILISAFAGSILGPKLRLKPTAAVLLSTLLTVLFLALVFKFTKVCEISDGFSLSSGGFQVTPAKLCGAGPYMTSTGPYHEMCKKMWSSPEGRAYIGEYNCLNGTCGPGLGASIGHPYGEGLYNGRPLHFERTPMSDKNWENNMCQPPVLQEGHPRVL